jgi:hypothetical protein
MLGGNSFLKTLLLRLMKFTIVTDTQFDPPFNPRESPTRDVIPIRASFLLDYTHSMGDMLTRSKFQLTQIILVCFLFLLLAGITLAVVHYLPPGIDWQNTYRPATQAVLAGESPYTIDVYYAPPWAVLPLIPFAVLPEETGRAILLIIGFLAYLLSALRLGAKPPALVAFLLSPLVLHNLLNSNLDWLPLLGFTLPPQIGLFFVLVKPQVGIGVAIFWVVEAWMTGGLKNAIRISWPVVTVTLISFVIFGLWPLRFSDAIQLNKDFNASLWPLTLPLGMTLLVTAIRKKDIRYSMPAGPCLSPYALFHSWIAALAPLLSHNLETIVAVIGLWGMVIIQASSGAL